MKKYTILIPIYNDRESLTKLIENINEELNSVNAEVSILVINDASSQQIVDTYPNLENIHSFEIINMKQNRGHARCIASGLKYIYEKKKFDYVIPMDGDGEDRPEEIKNFIELSEKAGEQSIVGERVKRSEGLLFQICYKFHKFLTSVITGSKIRTMWMTPFYLFFGTLFVYMLQTQINIKKLKPFVIGFVFFFFLSPVLYAYVSISKDDKRTDYPGKEIAIKTQYAWDQQFDSKINVVLGNEWNAGNLSYHLKSRPVWEGFIERSKLDQLKDYMCLDNVCVGSR